MNLIKTLVATSVLGTTFYLVKNYPYFSCCIYESQIACAFSNYYSFVRNKDYYEILRNKIEMEFSRFTPEERALIKKFKAMTPEEKKEKMQKAKEIFLEFLKNRDEFN
ncbi:MAG: hypothetical protein ACOYT4_00420 [Nanoarchaeota archaeon]